MQKNKINSNKILFFQKVEFIKWRVLIVIECQFFLHNVMYFWKKWYVKSEKIDRSWLYLCRIDWLLKSVFMQLYLPFSAKGWSLQHEHFPQCCELLCDIRVTWCHTVRGGSRLFRDIRRRVWRWLIDLQWISDIQTRMHNETSQQKWHAIYE